MRLAVFTDVHANLTALRAVLADIQREGPFHLVVSNGDQLSGGPRPLETWNELQAQGVCALCGDTERDLAGGEFPPEPAGGERRAIIEAIFNWTLAALPADVRTAAAARPRDLRISMDGSDDLLVTHANALNLDDFIWPDTPPAELDRLIGSPKPGLMVVGHIHAPLDLEVGATRIVRPGSVGLKYERRWFNVAHWAALEWEPARGAWSARTRAVTWDHEDEIAEGRRTGYPGLKIMPGYDRG